MAYQQKFPQALAWMDLETTSLPFDDIERQVIDFSGVHVLEIAVILTDFDLNAMGGYKEVLKLTPEAAQVLRDNDYVRKMHQVNGLLKESIEAPAEHTLAFAESEIIQLIKDNTTFEPGEFMIAGSGVAAFDHPLIKVKMPKLARYFAYYPFDIGVERRVSKILARRDIINPVKASFQDGVKVHRAMDDTQAHLEEATRYKEWFQSVLGA